MSLLVKICGLSTPEALRMRRSTPAADMVGFVFFAPSPRTSGSGWRASSASACAAGPARWP